MKPTAVVGLAVEPQADFDHCEFTNPSGKPHHRIGWHVVVLEGPAGVILCGLRACADHAARARARGLRTMTRRQWQELERRTAEAARRELEERTR